MAMKEIDIREVKENLVHLLADEWALVTAGRGDALGTMAVSASCGARIWPPFIFDPSAIQRSFWTRTTTLP